MRMSEWDQGITFTKNAGRGFLFSLHTSYTVDCPVALVDKYVFSGCCVQVRRQASVFTCRLDGDEDSFILPKSI
jgi:hypothetical protein